MAHRAVQGMKTGPTSPFLVIRDAHLFNLILPIFKYCKHFYKTLPLQ